MVFLLLLSIFLILSTFSGEWCDLQFHYFQNPCIYGTKLNWRVLWLMNAKKKIHLPWSPSLVLVQDWTDPANCKIFSPSLIFDKFWQIQQAVKSSVLLWYLINLTNSASEWGHCQTALSFVFFLYTQSNFNFVLIQCRKKSDNFQPQNLDLISSYFNL